MKALWTAAEAAAAVGVPVEGDWRAGGVSIDTRTLRPGDLFVALAARRDGHEFVAEALEKGAAAALVSRRPDGLGSDAPLLVAPCVMLALKALARAARGRTGARVAAITGSVGKTTTKDMLRAALVPSGTVHASERSYNNHWGVPLTLARMPRDADFAVVEIGMNRPGEIAPLARLARPNVAIVVTVAPAHLEAFDGLDGIAREKASIFDGLEPGGTALFHGDVETAPILAASAKRAGARLQPFGEGAGNFHRLVETRLAEGATVARARLWRQPILYRIASPGRHLAINALAALGAAKALGADPALAAAALGRWTALEGRGARETVLLDPVERGMAFDLIDDAYNANPASVAASLEALADAEPVDGIGKVARGRRIAVLGDMLELGPEEARLHAELAGLPAMERIDRVHCVGARMRALHAALSEDRRGVWAEDAARIAGQARGLADAGDVVLVKGSRSIGLDAVVDALRELGHWRNSAQGRK